MSSITRRAVLVGACGTCAAAATGCAGYSPRSAAGGGAVAPAAAPATDSVPATDSAPGTGSAPDSTPAPDSAPAATPEAVADTGLVSTAEVPVGGGVILAAQDLVITQPTAGRFKAFSATCTHQGCAVTSVANGTINCACHDSSFALADGSVIGGPAPKPLPEKAIAVQGTAIRLA